MERYEFLTDTLWDPPDPLPAERRVRAQEFVQRQIDAVRRTIFPTHKL